MTDDDNPAIQTVKPEIEAIMAPHALVPVFSSSQRAPEFVGY